MFLLGIILFFVLIALFVSGGVLFLLTRLFKIPKASYKISFSMASLVLILQGISDLPAINRFRAIAFIFSLAVGLLIFIYFFKRIYDVDWKKSLIIFLFFLFLGTITVGIAVSIPRAFFVEPFVVRGNAMNPTYVDGDYIIIKKVGNQFSRSDIDVFRNPQKIDSLLIERIIALPGETLEIQNGNIFINGKQIYESYTMGETSGNVSIKLSENEFFMLGDNRNQSTDSRKFGPIHSKDIRGKVFYKVPTKLLVL